MYHKTSDSYVVVPADGRRPYISSENIYVGAQAYEQASREKARLEDMFPQEKYEVKLLSSYIEDFGDFRYRDGFERKLRQAALKAVEVYKKMSVRQRQGDLNACNSNEAARQGLDKVGLPLTLIPLLGAVVSCDPMAVTEWAKGEYDEFYLNEKAVDQ